MEVYLHAFLTRTRDTDGQIHISSIVQRLASSYTDFFKVLLMLCRSRERAVGVATHYKLAVSGFELR